jgi:hypothetical protein
MKAGKQPVYRLTRKTQLTASVFLEMAAEGKDRSSKLQSFTDPS